MIGGKDGGPKEVKMTERKIGVWIIGAFGSIAATMILGALAIRRGMTGLRGMITGTEPFAGLGLAPIGKMEFAGCDVRRDSLSQAVRQVIREAGSMDEVDLDEMGEDLTGIEHLIRPGTIRNCGNAISGLVSSPGRSNGPVRDEIATVMEYLQEFKSVRKLDQVVVVNLASTEPPLPIGPSHRDLRSFDAELNQDRQGLVRASTIYAYAAIESGCPYINFTPSNGALFPAMVQLSERNGVPVMGNDGKTGETLVKSALAPMFLCRNLEVLSWEGVNLLGNMDGRVLDNPENRESKIQTKDGVISKILGYSPHSRVHINYVPSLSDQKTAWDFIHFRGFLGAKMSLQFVWQAHDSLLAAPLVLDLVRLADLAKRRGEAGLMKHLACYFKDPVGVDEHRLYVQFESLLEYARKIH